MLARRGQLCTRLFYHVRWVVRYLRRLTQPFLCRPGTQHEIVRLSLLDETVGKDRYKSCSEPDENETAS